MPTPLELSRTALTVASATPSKLTDAVLVSAADLKAVLQSEANALSALQLFTSHLTITSDPNAPATNTPSLSVSILPGHTLNIKA